MSRPRTILATSAGFRPDGRYGLAVGPVLHHALELAGVTGRRPRLCLVNTATGDDTTRYALSYAAFARDRPDVQLSHLALFPMPTQPDPAAHLLEQDVVWVGGGSVANLLAVWRAHGLDDAFRHAWEAGVVLGGGVGWVAVLARRRHDRLLRTRPPARHQRSGAAAALQHPALRL